MSGRFSWAIAKRLLFVLFILAVAFSFAMFQGGFLSWFIFYTLLPFALYSIAFFFSPISKFRVERFIHTSQIRKGGKMSVSIVVKRTSRFPMLYALVEERSGSKALQEAAGNQLKKLRLIGFRNSFELEYEVTHMPRGEHILEGVQIEVSDFFGWVKKGHFFPLKQTVLVYPNVTEMIYAPIETRYDYGQATSPFTIVKDTTMATGIRDYQPGDRVSWIHWKSFAKTQTLRTKEFEDRQSQELFLLLDRSPSNRFEETVELTASILHAVVRNQASAAFLSLGKKRVSVPAIQSEEQLQRTMLHLAKVKDDLHQSVESALMRDTSIANASTVLVLTGRLTQDMIIAIPRAAKKLRLCTIFVVLKRGEKPTPHDLKVHAQARARGMVVKVLTQETFANAFTEVGK
ncbi:DUF58 domain-containing protein [Paenisporosarcina cavernae]|uniref:DUF58 domain-containing protein n=1 Tax=Paenisporosarcina cavernae TaxID=2320858 RepID=A0A385YV24_9BACL|nr:DUF58 domain-containing protein [Paenisporosarcina cavernae]AYC30321.1 DUF58 domain-containing protein [Paenisporosarcina cavernae]